MKNITGVPVRGADFFRRDKLIAKARELINKDSNILIAAPRRVGKTSLMFFLMDHAEESYYYQYLITESVNNENEFYRRLVNKLLKNEYVKKSQKIVTVLKIHLPKITKISLDGIEFGTKDKQNYFEMVSRILKVINSENVKLVLLLDEFPETLENINRDEGESAAIHFLQSNRELRQDPGISGNVRFIYTGSIGLENIVAQLNVGSTIMDLSRLKVPPLNLEEARQFSGLLLADTPFTMDEDLVNRTLTHIQWLIPFYIQLVIEELTNLCRDENITRVTGPVLDRAFISLLERRNAFEHWHTRLRAALKTSEYNFAKELLNILSEKGSIHSNEILDSAVKYSLENNYKELVNSLVYDGYINNQEQADVYKYNSPLLQLWWRQNVAH